MTGHKADVPSAVNRAEALLTRWERRRGPASGGPPPPANYPAERAPAVRRAEELMARAGRQANGRGVVRVAARGYVWLAAQVQAIAGPIQQDWQSSVAEARRDQEQQAARHGGPGAGLREERQEKQGEGKLKKTAGATAEAASAATDAAGA